MIHSASLSGGERGGGGEGEKGREEASGPRLIDCVEDAGIASLSSSVDRSFLPFLSFRLAFDPRAAATLVRAKSPTSGNSGEIDGASVRRACKTGASEWRR